MPLNIIEHKGDTDVANIDKLLVVCSNLTNLAEPIGAFQNHTPSIKFSPHILIYLP